MASEIKESQMYTDYLTYDSVPIKSLIAGDNCAITTDGSGAYTVEAQIVTPMFHQDNWLVYDMYNTSTPYGSWVSPTELEVVPTAQGSTMGGGSTWSDNYRFLAHIEGGSDLGTAYPGTAGKTVRISGTLVEPGFADTVFYANSQDYQIVTSYIDVLTPTTWKTDLDFSGTAGFRLLAFYQNADFFPWSIDKMEIL